jgi:hypothetical protein
MVMKIAGAVTAALLLSACGTALDSAGTPKDEDAVFEGPVERAACGPGSLPETKLQGQVSLDDRNSGRAELGYRCNLELVGQHQGEGAGFVSAFYEDCAYYPTAFFSTASGTARSRGVQVVDASDPAKPVFSTNLITPAMEDPWESLKLNDKRGLLGADAGWNIAGPLFFDVYDVTEDCAAPKLLASLPDIQAGHEGDWAPDGLTYYVGSGQGIVDVTNPMAPLPIQRSDQNSSSHGLSISNDGNRMYAVGPSCGNGLIVYDTSQVQSRKVLPAMPTIGELCWEDGTTGQHSIPIFYGGKPYLVFVDEGGYGAARIIDIADENHPFVISKLKLEIHMPDNRDIAEEDGAIGLVGYDGHYCSVDRQNDPTTLGCGYIWSGIRVFDIRDPYHPKEIAYYIPPAQIGKTAELGGSGKNGSISVLATAGFVPSDGRVDACTSPVRLVPERGELWTTCTDNGFMVLKFTNGVWPFKD